MTNEPQVTLTAPPITHVWVTTYESEFERKQRKVGMREMNKHRKESQG